ncbi:MAG TPA: S1 RNA-binding domain-containing protein [Dehalococcoidia bacterium]|nr:S1 RNA-binding domain-containing protein [Dehalococcoidia bacterium]
MVNNPEEQAGQRGGTLGIQDDASMDMAALLAQEEANQYQSLRRGDVVEGTIIAITRDGVIVDIGAKSEGMIPVNEMHSLGAEPLRKVATGDKVVAFVLQPETPEGEILLSLDRARGERGWRVLQQLFESGESFEAEVTGFNKGGLLVNVEGVAGFVPLSQLVGLRPERSESGASGLQSAVGKTLRLKVIELNRRRNRVILSERGALQEWRSQQKERLLSELEEGEVRRGRISSIRNFGVFVDLGGADGLVHLSEISWDRTKSPEELFKLGDEVDVYVMKVDAERKKIALSIRRAQPAHWDGIVDKYQVGEVVPGIVTKLATFGAFARIEGPVEGLIHVSELVDRRISHSQEAVREGDILPLKIIRIERDRHRLGLSLKQAREQGERMGFTFGPDGEVLSVPPEIREAFRDELAAILGEEAVEAAEAAEERESPTTATARAADNQGTMPDAAGSEVSEEDEEEELPQTQMAAAFAALKMDQLASDSPPEETKA